MGFEERDRLRNLERNMMAAQDALARVPLTWPVGDDDRISVLLRRCTDGKEVVADDVASADGSGKLSANIGRVAGLLESAVLDADCWLIVKTVNCQPDICPNVCKISNSCNSCGNCVKLTPCGSGSEIITQLVCGAIGSQVLLDDGLCYTVSSSSTCAGSMPVVVVESITDCNSCTTCWKLERCCDNTITKNIYRDGHSLDPNPNGIVVRIDGECWLIRPGFQEPVNKTVSPDPCPVSPAAIHIPSSSVALVSTLSTPPSQPQHPCTEAACLYDFIACPETAGGDLVVRSATDFVSGDPVDLSTMIDRIVRTDQGGCYTVQVSTSTCASAIDAVIQEEFLQCENAGATSNCNAWLLERCDNSSSTICTFNDLSAYAADDVLKRAEDEVCYKMVGETSWSNACVAFTVEEEYDICDDCTTPKYRLVPNCPTCCGGANPSPEVTDEDFSAVVGQYIKYEKKCYLVETALNSETVTLPAPVTYTGPFGSCTACQKECRWIVEDVSVANGVITQRRIRVEFDKICDEDSQDLNTPAPCQS